MVGSRGASKQGGFTQVWGPPPQGSSSGESQSKQGEARPPRAERVAAWDRGASILACSSVPARASIQERHRANSLLSVCEVM